MSDSYTFAVDVFRTFCDRLGARATDLRRMVETASPFEERGVPVQERLQLRLQTPQLLDVHRTLRPETIPVEVVDRTFAA